ncbi:hypothetical protein [Streptomyces sp. NPDC051567]|uniref:hypothetical protein n=1 Tax=Streptomyces sp. NPDC051567 TaxID=3365660 RepID=UPI0037895DC4
MAYGQVRIALVDRVVDAGSRLARAGRVAVRLLTVTRMRPTDIYAALATARFLAAHELIGAAADAVEASGDPDIELIDLRTPMWFGAITLHNDEETQG